MDKQFVIDDLETLKVIADPLRVEILKTLRFPKTVKAIAAEIGRPPTKLYYHVNQLEEHKLIRVVATNVVSGIIEKQYQATARNYTVDDNLLSDESFSDENLEALIVTILDDTKAEIRKSMARGLIDITNRAQKSTHFIHGAFRLSAAEAAELGSELESLCKKYEGLADERSEGVETRTFGYTVALYPAYRPSSQAKDEGRGENEA